MPHSLWEKWQDSTTSSSLKPKLSPPVDCFFSPLLSILCAPIESTCLLCILKHSVPRLLSLVSCPWGAHTKFLTLIIIPWNAKSVSSGSLWYLHRCLSSTCPVQAQLSTKFKWRVFSRGCLSTLFAPNHKLYCNHIVQQLLDHHFSLLLTAIFILEPMKELSTIKCSLSS